jgi:hypothetical protein
MAVSKRAGGPKTQEGKSKSSLNATKFGVSTFRAIDDEERQLVARFAKDLIDFYQPDSPLEIMQLERIALCRAKLARLYEVERTRLQLAQHTISASPQKILDQLGMHLPLTKKIALEQIEYQSITLPLYLKLKELEAIVDEVHQYAVKTLSERELKRNFPTLYRYLDRHQFYGAEEDASTLSKLQVVLKKLKKILESDNPLMGRLAQLLESVLQKESSTKEEDASVRDLMFEISPDYAKKSSVDLPLITPKIDLDLIFSHLHLFADLLSTVQQAQKLVVQFEQSHALIVKSLVLPQTEADLLLRYQTTWERRLSTEVGEFIELRRYGR